MTLINEKSGEIVEMVIPNRKEQGVTQIPMMDDKLQKPTFWSVRNMYLAAFLSLLGSFAVGTAIGYPAVAIPNMQRTDSRLKDLMSSSQVRTWFSSLIAIGAFIGAFIAGPVSTYFGRRTTLMVTSGPFTAGWVLIAYSESIFPLMLGRFTTGVCTGMMCVAVPMYVVEIATSHVRGLLGCMFGTCAGAGVLLSGLLGTCLNWDYLAITCALLPQMMGVGMWLFCPESPRWLVSKERFDDAEKSLEILHGRTTDASEEIRMMIKSLQEAPQGKVTWAEIKRPQMWKPSAIALGLMFFQQFSGVNAFLIYAVPIFQNAGTTDIPPVWCAIIIQATQVVFTILSSGVIDRLGRRLLLITSAIGMGVALGVFGTFRFLKHNAPSGTYDDFQWIPVVCLFLFVATFSVGFGPIPWLMVAELVPLRIRGTVSSAVTGLNWSCFFIITKMFDDMMTLLGDFGVYWFYAFCCMMALLFTLAWVPETVGKSPEELEELFSNDCRTYKRNQDLEELSTL